MTSCILVYQYGPRGSAWIHGPALALLERSRFFSHVCVSKHTLNQPPSIFLFFKSTSSRSSVSQTAYLPMNRGSAWLWLSTLAVGVGFSLSEPGQLGTAKSLRLANTCHPSEAYDECNV